MQRSRFAFKTGVLSVDESATPNRGGGNTSRRTQKEHSQVQTLTALAHRRRDDEEGFTLIELMVVVLIIAILIAIAIPTFLGARARAQDRAAQSDLRNGLTAEKTAYTDASTYDTAAQMLAANIEPSLNSRLWNLPIAGAAVTVSADTFSVCLQETSKSTTVFSILDISEGTTSGTYYAKAACPAVPPSAGGAVPAGFGPSW
jgi:type IV pilus assembly protein PilA